MADTKKTTTKVVKKAAEVKTLEQLHEELIALRAEHLDARKSHRAGEIVNPHILTTQRKGIARILTAMNTANRTAVKEEN